MQIALEIGFRCLCQRERRWKTSRPRPTHRLCLSANCFPPFLIFLFLIIYFIFSYSYIRFPLDAAPECGVERIEWEDDDQEVSDKPKPQYHGVRLVRRFEQFPAVRTQESIEHAQHKPPTGFSKEEVEKTLLSKPQVPQVKPEGEH